MPAGRLRPSNSLSAIARPGARNIILVGVFALLAGVGAASAASSDFNRYSATQTFKPGKAGTATNPSPLALHEVLMAKGLNGHQAGPLRKVVSKTYGIRYDLRDFPKCTDADIERGGAAGEWDRVCPKGSLIGEGPVSAILIPRGSPTGPGIPCSQYLHIYNGGANKIVLFLVSGTFSPNAAKYKCDDTTTGTSAPPYDGTISYSGGSAVVTIPMPAYVSAQAGYITGAYESLIKLDVVYKSLTKTVKGKAMALQASVGCKQGKRPYSFTLTATNYQGQSPPAQTTMVNGSAKC